MIETLAVGAMMAVALVAVGFAAGWVLGSTADRRKLDEILKRTQTIHADVNEIKFNTGPVPGEMDV